MRRLQIDRQIDAIVKQKKNPRQKKRKNNADEDVLDRFADEEVTQLREEMLRAAADDDEANRDKMPGVAKLKLLPRVKDVLQKFVFFALGYKLNIACTYSTFLSSKIVSGSIYNGQ